MAIQRVNFQTYNRPALDMLLTIENEPTGERLDLAPPYQRESVWTTEQRVALVKSLMQGLPIGALFLNQRDIMEPVRVVDGKQRIETLLMWLRNELAIPAEWLEPRHLLPYDGSLAELPDVYWRDLSTIGQRLISNDWTVATYETKLRTEAQEAELYERINFSGTPHVRLGDVHAA